MSIIQMSMSAGMLVASIILIRTIALNKLPKIMFLILWSIVLLRLLIPVSIPSRFSVYNYFENVVDKKTANETTDNETTANEAADNEAADNEAAYVNENPNGYVPPADQTIINVKLSIPWFVIVWIIGMSSVIVYFIISYIKSFNKLRFALPVCGNKFIDEWLKNHKLIRRIRILYSDRISTPIAAGIIRPRIILPKFIDMDDEQLLKHVLMHEYCHIKRNDILWKLISAAVLCIHWFNPFVWVMFMLACRDLELTCDEMVIRRLGLAAKTTYAYSLISMSEKQSKLIPLHIGFGQNAAKERIVSVMKYKRTSLFSIILAILLIIGIPAVFAASAVQDKNEIDSQEIDTYSKDTDEYSDDTDIYSKDINIKSKDKNVNKDIDIYNTNIYNNDIDIYNDADLYGKDAALINDDSFGINENSNQFNQSKQLAKNEVNDSAAPHNEFNEFFKVDKINKDIISVIEKDESIVDKNMPDVINSDENILEDDIEYMYMMSENIDLQDSLIGTAIIVTIDNSDLIIESYSYDEWIKMLDGKNM